MYANCSIMGLRVVKGETELWRQQYKKISEGTIQVSGRRMMNVEPIPGLLSTSNSPPCPLLMMS